MYDNDTLDMAIHYVMNGYGREFWTELLLAIYWNAKIGSNVSWVVAGL